MEEVKKPLFRVGGVYRNGYGSFMKIGEELSPGISELWFARSGEALYSTTFRLSDGRCIETDRVEQSGLHLIPGELHQVNGEWVPVETDAEEQRSLARLERLRTLEVADRNCAMRPSDEIPPAPLPVEKVGGFDAFKGWAPVEWSVICQPQPPGLPSSDLQRASHQVHYEHGSAVWAGEKKK